ncbi:hypothetical protein [Rhodoferax ferrireducens]|uniref:hypothetical protein n=1 Tax=Rhodoferax ferrireducens TaxID=192843 RepID=UPI000E0DCEEE|nr:hypothetical protein [Rhodoferax ferrireducens]
MKFFTKATSQSGRRGARNRSRIHTALILTPSEVESNFHQFGEDGLAKIRGRWMLLGAVNADLFSRLDANGEDDIAAQLLVQPVPSGAKYTVLTCQLGYFQHRFVLPMYEPKVVDLLTIASMSPLSIYLESTGQVRQGMAYDCPLRPMSFQEARSECLSISADKKNDFIIEFPSVVSALASTESVPSLNREIVRDVDASFYLPRPIRQS